MRTGLAVVLILFLVSTVSVYNWFTVRSELSAARTSIKTLTARTEAAEALLLRRSNAAVQHSAEQQSSNLELRNEISKEPDWSSTTVPDGIATGLCKRLQCP